jgi:hypothetical protein
MALMVVEFKLIFNWIKEPQSMELLVNKDYQVVVVLLAVVVGLLRFGQGVQILGLELGLLVQVAVVGRVEKDTPKL